MAPRRHVQCTADGDASVLRVGVLTCIGVCENARFYFGDFSIGGNPDRFKRIVASLAAEVRVHRGGGHEGGGGGHGPVVG